jgi:hypothetical protein
MPIKYNKTHRRVGGALVPFIANSNNEWVPHHYHRRTLGGALYSQNGFGARTTQTREVKSQESQENKLTAEQQRIQTLKAMAQSFKL